MHFRRLAQAVLKVIPISKLCSPVHRRCFSRFKNKLDGGIAYETEYEVFKFLRSRLIFFFVRAFFLLLMKPSCGEKWPHSIATSHTIGPRGSKCRNQCDVRWVFRPVSLEVHGSFQRVTISIILSNNFIQFCPIKFLGHHKNEIYTRKNISSG